MTDLGYLTMAEAMVAIEAMVVVVALVDVQAVCG